MESLTVAGFVFAIGWLFLFFIRRNVRDGKKRYSTLPRPPEIPGLPIVGNLLQLKEKKPYKTFTEWAEKYGPIYSIRAGANSVVVLNTKEIAKEAMIERYSSISTRKLSNALTILTFNKCMVATSDYNEFHKVSKRHLLASTLGSSAQKRHRAHREIMMDRICKKFHAHLRGHPSEPVNFRKIFKLELFGLGLKQGMGIGREFKSIYVKELGATLSKEELFKILVADPLEGAIEVDWRDFFPYLKWIPNKKFEIKLQQMFSNRQAVMNALIKQQRTRVQAGEAVDCYFDYLLSQSTSLSEQLLMLLWEDLIGTSDTTLVATEWAMYELCRSPDRQKHLYSEIQKNLRP